MRKSVQARRGRLSRLIWLGLVLVMAGGACVATLTAITCLATGNLVISLAHRPKVMDGWRQPSGSVEASKQRPTPGDASIFAEQERRDEAFLRAEAAGRGEGLAGLRDKLAEAPLMFDQQRSALRPTSLQTGTDPGWRDANLLDAAPAGEARRATALAMGALPRDEVFQRPLRVISAQASPVLATAVPELPPARVAAIEEATPSPPAPRSTEADQVVLSPVPDSGEPARVTPLPTPRPSDFASVAQERASPQPRVQVVPVRQEATVTSVPAAQASRPIALAYATPELQNNGGGVSDLFHGLLGQGDRTAIPDRRSRIAVYDIESATVRLPNGERLEAHSGLGHRQDDPRYVREKNRGPTPPNVYNLVMREGRFHGAEAIRLLPSDQKKVFNRDGLLAHPYMYVGGGSRSQSNGCVVFKNYDRFLTAFKAGQIARLVVVSNMGDLPTLMSAR